MKGLFFRIKKGFTANRSVAASPTVTASTSSPEQLITEAMQNHHAGRMVDAERLYRLVLTIEPDHFDATHLLGVLAHQSGNSAIAIDMIGRAVHIRPDDVSARSNLGLAYRQNGQLVDAEASLRRAVELNPRADRSVVNLGVVLRELGDLAGAEAQFNAALQLNATNDDATTNLANIYRETGRLVQAEALYRTVVAARPDRADLRSNLAALYLEQGRWTDAEQCLQSVIDMGGATAETFSNLGYAHLQVGRPNEAELACRTALTLREAFPDAWINLALVQKALGELDAAATSCRRALEIAPLHVSAHVNLGTIQREQGDLIAAEASYRRVLQIDARSPAARFNLGSLQLLRGDYPEGFALLESRFELFRRHHIGEPQERFLEDVNRRWHGQSIVGRRVAIWGEQGHGDNLMMLRYLPLLKQLGARHVQLICEPGMARIAAAAGGADTVTTWDDGNALGEYDVHCPAMSLPACFGTTISSIPGGASYLAIPESLSLEWSKRPPDDSRLRVGLAWAGSPGLRDDAQRSIALGAFAPLLGDADVDFYSLQKGHGADQTVDWPVIGVGPVNACADFMDTAVLISGLDLVISVDTAIAHLAGALGKPVWLLNRAASEWRWGTSGSTTPWYPTMRIFRQQTTFDWAPVMMEIVGELNRLIQSRRVRRV